MVPAAKMRCQRGAEAVCRCGVSVGQPGPKKVDTQSPATLSTNAWHAMKAQSGTTKARVIIYARISASIFFSAFSNVRRAQLRCWRSFQLFAWPLPKPPPETSHGGVAPLHFLCIFLYFLKKTGFKKFSRLRRAILNGLFVQGSDRAEIVGIDSAQSHLSFGEVSAPGGP